jgi:hypothetical protein
MRSSNDTMDRDLIAMRSDTVLGMVTGLLLAVVAMTLVLALGRSPVRPPVDSTACEPPPGSR